MFYVVRALVFSARQILSFCSWLRLSSHKCQAYRLNITGDTKQKTKTKRREPVCLTRHAFILNDDHNFLMTMMSFQFFSYYVFFFFIFFHLLSSLSFIQCYQKKNLLTQFMSTSNISLLSFSQRNTYYHQIRGKKIQSNFVTSFLKWKENNTTEIKKKKNKIKIQSFFSVSSYSAIKSA